MNTAALHNITCTRLIYNTFCIPQFYQDNYSLVLLLGTLFVSQKSQTCQFWDAILTLENLE